MGITLSGSLNVTGSLLVNGTAVSTGSGGSVSLADNFMKYVNLGRADYTSIVDTNGQILDVHLSASNATYLISSSATLTTSASVNLYFYPEYLNANEVTFAYFDIPPRGTVSTIYTIRCLPTLTGSGAYWYPNTAPGGASSNVTSQINVACKKSPSVQQNCTTMFKDENGNIWFNTFGNYPYNTTAGYIYYTSSQGTPIT